MVFWNYSLICRGVTSSGAEGPYVVPEVNLSLPLPKQMLLLLYYLAITPKMLNSYIERALKFLFTSISFNYFLYKTE